MVAFEQVFGITGELSTKQGKVPRVLVILAALVPHVLKQKVTVADRTPVLERHAVDGRHDPLVDDALKADPRIIAPQAVLTIWGGVTQRPQEHPESESPAGGIDNNWPALPLCAAA